MEFNYDWNTLLVIFGVFVVINWVLKRVNVWYYENYKLGDSKKYANLPPGDMGWPLIGNMWSFLLAFWSTNPDSFMSDIMNRYGRKGVYKSFMFGSPSIIVTTPEACKKALTDDEAFEPGWPKSTLELIGKKSFVSIGYEEHKRLRKITSAPVNGHEALSLYTTYIETIVISSLEKWSSMGQIEFLTEMRRVTFKIIMYIFMSSESEDVMEELEREYTTLNYGVRALAINIPGFAYYKALKARTKLVAIIQKLVDERRARKAKTSETNGKKKKDMMDILLDEEDENGKKLTDEEIIDLLVMYLNAGHESSGHVTMWATLLLQKHPQFFHKAKAEQEEIIKNRPAGQEGLTYKEVRKMEYLSKVVDETLRLVTFSSFVFRQAKRDVTLCGYTIPKGWKVLPWFRNLHMNPEIYPNPKEFNPARWDSDVAQKAFTFLPFGGGTRLCPGNDLAKIEISIFLHYFVLNYKLERENVDCPIIYLPHSRPKDNCLGRITRVTP